MNQSEKSHLLASAIGDAIEFLEEANKFIDEPDDDCPCLIKSAISRLNNALNECEKYN